MNINSKNIVTIRDKVLGTRFNVLGKRDTDLGNKTRYWTLERFLIKKSLTKKL